MEEQLSLSLSISTPKIVLPSVSALALPPSRAVETEKSPVATWGKIRPFFRLNGGGGKEWGKHG